MNGPVPSTLPIGADEMLRGDVKISNILLAVAAAMAITAAVLMPLGGKAFNIGLIFAILTSLPLLLGGLTWGRNRSVRRQLRELQRDHLVHWTYTADEWRTFDDTWTADRPIGEAYVGAQTAYCNRLFWEWGRLGCALVFVGWKDDSRNALDFVVYYHNPKTGGAKLLYRVPVPAGKQDEADRLVETLRTGKTFARLPIWGRLLWGAVAVFALAVSLFAMAVSFGFIK